MSLSKQTIVGLATLCLCSCKQESQTGFKEEEKAREPISQSLNLNLETDLLISPDVPYDHPLVDVPLINGKVPGVTTHDSPGGGRYGLGHWAIEDEDGNYSHGGGVETFEIITETPRSLEDAFGPAPYNDQQFNPVPKMGEKLSSVINDMISEDPAQLIGISVWFRDPMEPSERMIVHRLEEKIGKGIISTQGDYYYQRDILLKDREKELLDIQQQVVSEIEREMGPLVPETLRLCKYSPCINVSIPIESVYHLMNINEIEHFDLNPVPIAEGNVTKIPGTSDAALEQYSGNWMAEGTQIHQYYNSGFSGFNVVFSPSSGLHLQRIRIGLIEMGEVDISHWAFYDDGGSQPLSTSSRMLVNNGCESQPSSFQGNTLYFDNCNYEFAVQYNDPYPRISTSYQRVLANHATQMAGIIGGDLYLDQDPNINSSYQQRIRSGYTPKAYLYTGWYNLDKYAFLNGINLTSASPYESKKIAARLGGDPTRKLIEGMIKYPPQLVNLSIGDSYADKDCRGFDPFSRQVNSMYESGILPVKSAGNQSLGVTPEYVTKCNVTSPGSANGALVVAAFSPYVDPSSNQEFFNGDAYPQSSVGGEVVSSSTPISVNSKSNGRSIVDLSLQANAMRLPKINRSYVSPNDTGNQPLRGTSNSSALLTSSLSLFSDFFKSTFGNLIDDPGIMTSNALIMGDRTTGSGRFNTEGIYWDKLASGFSNIWGAGRFKARIWNGDGMDGNAEWRTGRACVKNGESVKIPITGGFSSLPPGVAILNTVVNWYDPDHQYKMRKDMFGMRIVSEELGVPNSQVTIANHLPKALEDKGRLSVDNIHEHVGKRISLIVTGLSVGGRETICGTDSNMVYYTTYYEHEGRYGSPGSSVETSETEGNIIP